MADEQREFNEGDGHVTLLANETATLYFECSDCGCDSSVTIKGPSHPVDIDCDEERLCKECQKKTG